MMNRMDYTPKFKKPGKPNKKAKIWNRARRSHDIGKKDVDFCIKCKKNSDTLRISHYEGNFKHKYGKGTGKKVADELTTLLCYECDLEMAKKPDKDDIVAVLNFEIDWCWLIIEYQLLI